MSEHVILAATRDRAAAGRGIVSMLSVAVVGGGLLIFALGHIDASVGDARVDEGEKDTPGRINRAGKNVLASAKIDWGNRCKISGYLNGVRLTFMVDTGAPRNVEMSSDLLPKFGIDASSLDFEEVWPGTRYGKIAKTTFNQLSIGSFVLNHPQVWIYDRWGYSFGDTEPLLGMATLKSAGIRLEVGDGSCRLLSS
jgi:hypothetical protein